MRITAYTQNCQATSNTDKSLQQIDFATQLAKQHGSNLLITPGWSLGCVFYFDRGKRKATSAIVYDNQSKLTAKSKLQDISNEHNIAIIAEVVDTYLFQPAQPISRSFMQRFADNGDDLEEYGEFAKEWNSGQRYAIVHGKTIGLMLCGENNYIYNQQSDGNRPSLRYPELGWRDDYDILINPTHQRMGNWGKLHQRFAWLSQNKRTVVHTANDTTNGGVPTKSTICVYHNGQRVVMGDFKDYPKDLWFVNKRDGWAIVTVDVRDAS